MKSFEVRINGTHDTADDVALALTSDGAHYPPDAVRVREMPIVADRVLANGARGVFVEADRYFRAMATLKRFAHEAPLTWAHQAERIMDDLGEVR